METIISNPEQQLEDGDILLVDYLNDLADQWRLQGYSEEEIAQGLKVEESRIDNIYYSLES